METPTETTPPIQIPEIFGDTTPDAVVEAMNRRIKRRNYSIPVGVVISAVLVVLSVRWPIALGIGALFTILGTIKYRRSKYSDLVYGNEKETAERLGILHKAVAVLRSADSLWSVRETSLDNGLTPHPPTLSRTKVASCMPLLPRYVRTNVTPAAVQLTDCALYFMPDRLFVWHSGHFSAIDYGDIKLRFSRVTFLERERQPPDALVKGQLRHSLADEKSIPVLYYGLVDIDAAPAFQASLMTSRPESAQEFAARMRSVTGELESTAQTAAPKEPVYTHFDDSRVPLFYDMSVESVRKLQKTRDAFAIIARCDYVWRNDGEKRTDDWKRNAGAGTLVTRTRIFLTVVDHVSGFESNVAVGLSLGGGTFLFLLPDGWVALNGPRFVALGEELSVKTTTCSFREEEVVPRDSEVIGRTWRYVNKKGGPDLRFNNNRQIPMYRYGQLEINCGSWQTRLTLSRASAAVEFAAAMRAALGDQEHGSQKERPGAPPPPRTPEPPAGVAAAFLRLGLPLGASLDEASAAYRSLAAQNHPDKVAHMAPEFRELAERKMRELNAANDLIRAFCQQRHSG
jgi:hypothetical protein